MGIYRNGGPGPGILKPQPQTGAEFHPRGRRDIIPVPAVARLCRERQVDVTVSNVSVGGFSAACPEAVPIGAQMILEVSGVGDLAAEIRWSIGGRFGAEFNGRLGRPEKELIAALVRMRTPSDEA